MVDIHDIRVVMLSEAIQINAQYALSRVRVLELGFKLHFSDVNGDYTYHPGKCLLLLQLLDVPISCCALHCYNTYPDSFVS